MNSYFKFIYITLIYTQVLSGSAKAQNIISGIVSDSETGQTMEFVQVALMNSGDSALITGTVTEDDGRFRIETHETGTFLIFSSFVGFSESWRTIEVENGFNSIDTIAMVPSVTELGEVEISAVASLFRSEADRRIFSVENMTVAEGGTAIQLLETIPEFK